MALNGRSRQIRWKTASADLQSEGRRGRLGHRPERNVSDKQILLSGLFEAPFSHACATAAVEGYDWGVGQADCSFSAQRNKEGLHPRATSGHGLAAGATSVDSRSAMTSAIGGGSETDGELESRVIRALIAGEHGVPLMAATAVSPVEASLDNWQRRLGVDLVQQCPTGANGSQEEWHTGKRGMRKSPE